jgi:CRISPR-associated protein Cmr1
MRTRDPKKLFPEINVPEVAPKPDYRVTEIRRYKLITPLFGGGVEAQKADPITTIRGASVRGQLRFWWRATRGGQFEFDGDLEKMRQAENAIWGSAARKGDETGGPSKVQIVVSHSTEGAEDHPFEVVAKSGKPIPRPRTGSSAPSYASFPLQPKREEAKVNMETLAVKVGVKFTLEISYPKAVEQDVQAALWAWETFGGIGARTRRGFGALQLVSVDDKASLALRPGEVEAELRNKLREHAVVGRWPDQVPHLTRDMRLEVYIPSGQYSSSIHVWNDLIKQLQDFRQKRHKRMGLSLWPEANEIRHRLKHDQKWPEQITSPRLVHKFPRAVFGLPILFHLPHDKHLPVDTFTLQGKSDPAAEKKFERLSSALILRPLSCLNDQAVGLAAVLDAPLTPPYGLRIEELVQDKQDVEWQLTEDEANSAPIREILHGQPDVIEAFLEYLKK